MKVLIALLSFMAVLAAQEAVSGIEIHGTVSVLGAYSHLLEQAPDSRGALAGGVRLMAYPNFKLSEHWSISAAAQLTSRPYFHEQFTMKRYGLDGSLLQAYLAYSLVRESKSLVIRVGQLSPAFGSFPLRYDDAVNPLIDTPYSYGYYGKGVTSLGLAGVQVDASAGKFDARAQFVNSSPANRRSVFDREQYGTWVSGIGYTLKQGFRIGLSSYRGAYLDRQSPFFFQGELNPKNLPATALGADLQYGRGPWSAQAELQEFIFSYHVIPTFRQQTGYVELKRTLSPRSYLAARVGYMRANLASPVQVWETAIGFRPNRLQVIKIAYEVFQGPAIRGTLSNTFAVQLVTTVPSIAVAR